MSVGFFIGFVFSDHSATTEHYPGLFLFATSGNFLAIVLAALNWKTLADRNTPLLDAERRAFSGRFVAGIAILIALVPTVWFLLQHPGSTETLVKAICAIVAAVLVWLTLRHRDPRERNNMWAYLILTLGSDRKTTRLNYSH